MKPKMQAFLSYSKMGADTVKPFRKGLLDGLNEHSTHAVKLAWGEEFPTIGNGSWLDRITGTISRSLLFFWVQTPRWFTREMCLFELAVFDAQAARIAAFLKVEPWQVTAEALRPIRLSTFKGFGRAPAAAGLGKRFLETQVQEDLNPAEHQLPDVPIPQRCHRAADDIMADVQRLAEDRLDDLLAWLAEEDRPFVEAWVDRAITRGILPRAPYDRETDAAPAPPDPDEERRRRPFERLKLPLLLLRDEEGAVAVTRDPLPYHFAPGSGIDRWGRAVWPRAEAARIDARADADGLGLPTAAQAARIAAAIAPVGADAPRTGSGPFACWVRDGGGAVRPHGTPTGATVDRLPIYLAERLDG